MKGRQNEERCERREGFKCTEIPVRANFGMKKGKLDITRRKKSFEVDGENIIKILMSVKAKNFIYGGILILTVICGSYKWVLAAFERKNLKAF